VLNAKNPSPIYIPTKEFPAPTRSLRVMSLVWTPTLPVVIVEENVETPEELRLPVTSPVRLPVTLPVTLPVKLAVTLLAVIVAELAVISEALIVIVCPLPTGCI
jgi:hypothetical protein